VVRLARVGWALSLALAWMGLWRVVAAHAPWLTLRLLAMFMFGLATSMAMVSCTGSMQVIAPENLRGRLLGLLSVVGFGAQPFATLACGALADRVGAPHAVAAAGWLAVAIAVGLLVQREWRRWRLA
jgi:MFS family permease